MAVSLLAAAFDKWIVDGIVNLGGRPDRAGLSPVGQRGGIRSIRVVDGTVNGAQPRRREERRAIPALHTARTRPCLRSNALRHRHAGVAGGRRGRNCQPVKRFMPQMNEWLNTMKEKLKQFQFSYPCSSVFIRGHISSSHGGN